MSANIRSRGFALAAAATGLSLLVSPLALTSGAQAGGSVTTAASSPIAKKPGAGKQGRWRAKLDLYAINDFHGQLERIPSTSSSGRVATPGGSVDAGGAEYLSTHLDQWRDESRARGAKPITVAAGDLIGATPLLSAAFHDEPTIQTMNKIGLKVSSVGNHEFDEGKKELRRMQRGGCLDDGPDGANNQNSCPDLNRPFGGAKFDYLAANVKRTATNKTLLPPYTVRKVDGERVAFVGMTLQNTPNIVTKSGVAGLRFTDEVKTVDRLIPKIRAKGIDAVVVLLHEGLAPTDITDINACENGAGPGLDIAKALHPEVDLVISGHTHQPYTCTVRDPNGRKRMITSAYSIGRVVTEINLKIRRRNGEIVRRAVGATNHIVTNSDGTEADDAITALINRYKALVEPISNEVLGHIAPLATGPDRVTRDADPNGRDSALGNLIADGQVADPSTIKDGKAPVVALMNPGGIRADLVEDENNDVDYGAAFSVQPFNNYVVSMDLTGQQILDVLNEQWNG
ncbi:MAG: 5'-nucleotidase C-terminal domain-containing protein, partial [Nocardioidaceae bacterium]|nr:5'-nucleotidase C-terminal domain-containing protein [Nocardioidaceae bacterium]